jgi:hypothetical protein
LTGGCDASGSRDGSGSRDNDGDIEIVAGMAPIVMAQAIDKAQLIRQGTSNWRAQFIG